MKVVLFCGGLGTRLGELSESVPKPMVRIGYRPILWHIMKYYAHFGHKDFILCLGHKADKVKEFFLSYSECLSNDFTMANGGKELSLENCDIADWRITFVDTGLKAKIGQRLKAVERYVSGEDIFLANYADGLTDLRLPEYINYFLSTGKIAAFVCVRPSQSFHVVTLANNNHISDLRYVRDTGLLINGGFFIFRKEIFKYIKDGEELVEAPFQRLIRENQLIGYKYDHFWCMDTFKEHQELTDMYNQGNAPWEVWRSNNRTS